MKATDGLKSFSGLSLATVAGEDARASAVQTTGLGVIAAILKVHAAACCLSQSPDSQRPSEEGQKPQPPLLLKKVPSDTKLLLTINYSEINIFGKITNLTPYSLKMSLVPGHFESTKSLKNNEKSFSGNYFRNNFGSEGSKIHLQFVLQYASNLYRSSLGAPTL